MVSSLKIDKINFFLIIYIAKTFYRNKNYIAKVLTNITYMLDPFLTHMVAWFIPLQISISYFSGVSHMQTTFLCEISSSHNNKYEDRAFWDIALCSLIEVDRHFTGKYCLHHHWSTPLRLHSAISQKALIFKEYFSFLCHCIDHQPLHS
jgi:hypothetical protein